jgi:hypothetical protein
MTEVFEYTTTDDSSGWTVEIDKLGGGTVGKSYEGHWIYEVTDAAGNHVASGGDLRTGTPKTHAQAARILLDFLTAESE